jgi:oxaloacetate decarboxylase beta subunit
MEKLLKLWHSTGLYHVEVGQLFMIAVCMLLIYLAIKKGFEPLLLIPIGFGGLLANIPVANMAEGAGFLHMIYEVGLPTSIFPLLIFLGVGAMTDFGPMLANPKTLLLGAAAQFGIFGTLLGALALTSLGIPGLEFTLKEAASIAIIGGADGPTSIFVTSKLAPHLLGPIAVAAYAYMALVPLIQPPIMRALTTKEERAIVMQQLRPVGQTEKIIFPIVLCILVGMLLPDAAPLVGMFALGNLLRESGVVERLADTSRKRYWKFNEKSSLKFNYFRSKFKVSN